MPRCKHEKALDALTKSVCGTILFIDQLMKIPGLDLVDRGKRIAKITNSLEMANDSAMHFALDMGWRKINHRKRGRSK